MFSTSCVRCLLYTEMEMLRRKFDIGVQGSGKAADVRIVDTMTVFKATGLIVRWLQVAQHPQQFTGHGTDKAGAKEVEKQELVREGKQKQKQEMVGSELKV